jgi:Alg9-like mannosyltransferase family
MLRWALLIAILSTLLRAWLAHEFYGFDTGDDVEIAQEAFRAAFGLEYSPWNLRNLFVSQALVAPFLVVARAIGVSDPFTLAQIARYPFLVLGGINVVLVFLLGRRWFDERSGLLAAGLYSIHWIPLVFGSSLYPRIPGTTFLLVAALLLTNGKHIAAGVLISLAFAMRYSEAIFLFPLIILGGGWQVIAGFAAGTVVFIGAYDWLSWGRPFASLIEFARYTLIARESSSLVKEQPFWWYLTAIPQWLAPPLWPFLWSEKRRAFAFIAVPVLALSFIHHKELRYLQAVIPFAIILAAAGAMRFRHRKIAVALLLLALPLQLARIRSVEKRSMAAVDAARVMQNKTAAVSQEWAYGGKLFLDPIEIGIPPEPARLREAAPRVDCVAMYRSQITPELRAIVAEAGLTAARTFERARSRPVEIFCR